MKLQWDMNIHYKHIVKTQKKLATMISPIQSSNSNYVCYLLAALVKIKHIFGSHGWSSKRNWSISFFLEPTNSLVEVTSKEEAERWREREEEER